MNLSTLCTMCLYILIALIAVLVMLFILAFEIGGFTSYRVDNCEKKRALALLWMCSTGSNRSNGRRRRTVVPLR